MASLSLSTTIQQISSMAEVSNLLRFNHHQNEEEPEQPSQGEFNRRPNPFIFDFDFDSFSLPNSSSFEDYATSLNLGFDFSESFGYVCEEEPSFEDDDDDEQINFVTDLFESREARVDEDTNWEFDSSDSAHEIGGLRVTGMDSESDSEEFEVNSGFIINNDVVVDDENKFDSFAVGNAIINCDNNERDDLEWEEVTERFHFDERVNLNSVIDRIEEISVSSSISASEGEEDLGLGDDEWLEEERNHAWEVLMEMSNIQRNFDFEIPEEYNSHGSEAERFNFPEEVLTMEYDTIFGMLVENENGIKGSPPAAKSVVENLPSVVLTKEEIDENSSSVVCAVCKDEVASGEKVTRMPCCHLYHGDCILPWLEIRNTCPVCRFELPTDDADYEKRRSGSGSAGRLVDDFEARSSFELLH